MTEVIINLIIGLLRKIHNIIASFVSIETASKTQQEYNKIKYL